MSRRPVRWKIARRYFERRGYEIRSQGGDKIIIAPRERIPDHGRQTVRIGHKYCSHDGDELLPAHLSAIRRAFGVTRDELLR